MNSKRVSIVVCFVYKTNIVVLHERLRRVKSWHVCWIHVTLLVYIPLFATNSLIQCEQILNRVVIQLFSSIVFCTTKQRIRKKKNRHPNRTVINPIRLSICIYMCAYVNRKLFVFQWNVVAIILFLNLSDFADVFQYDILGHICYDGTIVNHSWKQKTLA